MRLRVHRIPWSTNVERVALAAGHKGLEVDWVDHDPDDRSAIVELSGQELVPVAEIDGQVVVDSTRIIERLEELRSRACTRCTHARTPGRRCSWSGSTRCGSGRRTRWSKPGPRAVGAARRLAADVRGLPRRARLPPRPGVHGRRCGSRSCSSSTGSAASRGRRPVPSRPDQRDALGDDFPKLRAWSAAPATRAPDPGIRSRRWP